MYGLVNKAMEDLIRSTHGDETWALVKRKAGVDTDVFLTMEPYPDSMSYGLVAAASEVLGRPAAELLEALGMHWTLYTAREGYGDLFRLGGATFKDFMLNLHMLHTRVALTFPKLEPPSFWCTHVTDGSLTLHYQSKRAGLGPMVLGLVKGLAIMYNTTVTVQPTRAREDGADHDEFLVTYSLP